jgi:hypothetical protein
MAAVLVIAGCGGGDVSTTSPATTGVTTSPSEPETTTAAQPTTVSIIVKGAAPQGGIKRVSVSKGENVVLVVHSDVADEIHLHGYNLSQDVAAGGEARIAFVADVPGQFEVELEQHGVQIANLTVNP